LRTKLQHLPGWFNWVARRGSRTQKQEEALNFRAHEGSEAQKGGLPCHFQVRSFRTDPHPHRLSLPRGVLLLLLRLLRCGALGAHALANFNLLLWRQNLENLADFDTPESVEHRLFLVRV
jgi:hypothetical protein